ncbi:hypothetical protein [Massilia niastensis]|uniref:hypothetical protein n=1 Tax=Massilia niastensis TaxID=544911 RepID=UPI0012EB5820|nr:hypothetical protein [Massilia niastensis]
MRYVDRSKVAEPPSLIEANKPTNSEMARAVDHYSSSVDSSFDFTWYKKNDVVTALESLFHKKCAYCESPYTAVMPVDVEHYRPKGRLEGEPKHLGYWWLALKWDNLLPSCIDCNRRRYHRTANPTGTMEWLERTNIGKLDAFPISGPRAFMHTDSTANEKALLLDPTSDNPDNHLFWPVDRELSVVSALEPEDDGPGMTTIWTVALNRQGLVETRTSHLNILKRISRKAFKFFDRAITLDGAHRKDAIDDGLEELEELKKWCSPDQPYSALANAFYRQTRQLLIKRYEALIENKEITVAA